ncbi:hypothetical protein POM88_014403 [Heracleum sosnowskyi]|uniref:Transposase-associated domain-containing protein n=1 Tax=Heracleum sosnowskyi TaxID=360622 RepID=A0AAD8J0B3_9APIA|nr:hypothetical protein POM88_014403 [Heracleum sosnowskyi]
MDRHTWMYEISRTTIKYVDGVKKFIICAMKDMKKNHKEEGKEKMILCPCHDCKIFKKYRSVDIVRDHLFRRGFKKGCVKWIWHGEGVHSSKTSGTKREREEDNTTEEDDMGVDRLEEMIQDMEDHFMHQPDILNGLVDDSKNLLFPGCNDQFTRLSATFRLSIDPIEIPKSCHEGRLQGQGTLGSKMISPSAELCDRSHLLVLQHMTEIDPYLKEHIALIRHTHPSKSGKWITNEHNRSFIRWFKERVMSQLSQNPSGVSNTLKWLAYGLDMPVKSYEGYDINGKRRILGIENIEGEEEYDQFDKNPPFSMGLPTSNGNEIVDVNYLCNDHAEGLWIDHQV